MAQKTNHVLHFILTLLTGGLWLFVWIPLAVSRNRASHPQVVSQSVAPAASHGRARVRAPVVVRVAYRDLEKNYALPDPENLQAGYAYAWAMDSAPEIGDRVFVFDQNANEHPAIIVGFDTDYRGDLLAVSRVATDEEISAASARSAETIWLNMALREAGLPASGRARKSPPAGYPAIPPSNGDATAEDAGEYGRVWWRAYKLATELGRDDDAKALRSIAHRWYAIRDRG